MLSKSFLRLVVLSLLFLFVVHPSFAQPTLWGMTTEGGPTGSGVIFKVKTNGSGYAVVHALEAEDGGGGAIGSQGMVLASDGLFYGATNRGGMNDLGTIFSFDPITHEYHKRIDFTEDTGGHPFGALMQASNGKIYCTTQWEGENGYGTLIEYDLTSNSIQVLFAWETGVGVANASFGVTEGDDGILYGTRGNWGSARKGLIFSYNLVSQVYEERYHFTDDNNGHTPNGVLTKLDDGTFLGVTETGGVNGNGIVYHFDPSSNLFTKKADVSGSVPGGQNGAYPVGFLTKHSNGKFYGLTQSGGTVINNTSIGTIFEYDHSAGTYTMKFSFYSTIGIRPSGKLILGQDGKLYGKTNEGGVLADQGGTFFSYDPIGDEFNKLRDFGGDFGIKPYGSLELEPDGKILGSTSEGGQGNGGVLFDFDPSSGDFELVRSLNYAPDGAAPLGSFTQDPSGKLLAPLSTGGQYGKGAIFQLDTKTGTFLRIADFDGTNGTEPVGRLLLADNGKYYGMTRKGGEHNLGVVYQFDYATNECIAVFHFDESSGSQPDGSLTKGTNGILFGIASTNGDNDWGTVFTFSTLTNTYTKIHDFTSSSGSAPTGSLKWFPDNMLYATTMGGGANNSGVIYRIDPVNGDYTNVFDFESEMGNQPFGDLLVTTNGNMYGLTSDGGEADGGVLFQFVPASGEYNVLKSFNESTGMFPMGSLTEGAGGKLFGMTRSGGTYGLGTLFSFNTSSKALSLIKNFDYTNGASPTQNNLLLIPSNQEINFSSQQLTFSAAPLQLTGTSNSGLALVYESSDNTIASINGDMITMHRTGTVTITSSQAGNIEYHPASPVQQTFTIKLGKPIALDPSEVTQTEFTARWISVEGAESYLLDVSTDQFSTFLPEYQQKPVVGLMEIITGLLPGVTYQYRIKAVGQFENTEYSNTIVIITPSPPAVPVALDATNVTQDGFTAHWIEVPSINVYELDVSSDNFSTFISSYHSKSINALSEVLSGLTPNTTYHYRVRARNAVGVSSSSEPKSVTTLAEPVDDITPSPPAVPVVLDATNITPDGFTTHWMEVPSVNVYELDVSSDNFLTFILSYHSKSVSGLSEALSGLTPNTTYQYRVRARNTVGVSSSSEPKSVTTLAEPVDDVTALSENDRLEILAYPNPAKDFSYVVTFFEKSAQLRIIQSGGQVILQKEAYHSGEEIDIKSFTPGLYLIEIAQGEKRYTTRLVKN